MGEFDEVQRPDDGQAAEAILAFEDGNGRLQLMVEKGGSAVGFQHLVNAGFEGPGQAENGGQRGVGFVAFDLGNDRFGDPGLLGKLAQGHIVGFAQALDRFAKGGRWVNIL